MEPSGQTKQNIIYQTSRWIERGYNDDFSDIIIEDFGTQLLVKPSFDFHSVSLSTGLSYDLGKNRSILFNYGLSNRAPNASELFSDGLHHSAARIELGDLRILKEITKFKKAYIRKILKFIFINGQATYLN